MLKRSNEHGCREMNLKDRTIYRLPNGRELVASVTYDKEILLSVSASQHGLYELNSEGRLLVDGQLTAWQIEDLSETGRVAGHEITSKLVELSTQGRESTNEQAPEEMNKRRVSLALTKS